MKMKLPRNQPDRVYAVDGLTLTVCWQRAKSLSDGLACSAFVPLWPGLDTAAAPEPAAHDHPVRPDSKPGLAAMFAAEAEPVKKTAEKTSASGATAEAITFLFIFILVTPCIRRRSWRTRTA